MRGITRMTRSLLVLTALWAALASGISAITPSSDLTRPPGLPTCCFPEQ
jgi:hypothetical protein